MISSNNKIDRVYAESVNVDLQMNLKITSYLKLLILLNLNY